MIHPGSIFIVDDDVDFSDSLKWLLESEGLSVTSFDRAATFLETYKGEAGCLLLDVRMPGMDGLAVQQKLLDMEAPLAVVIITGHASVPVAIHTMKRKAFDFLEKPLDDKRLISVVVEGLRLAQRQGAALATRAGARARWNTLTRREREVMALVVQGQANRDMAVKLGLSTKTIEIHRSRVMEKMKVSSLADLVLTSTGLGKQALDHDPIESSKMD